MPRIEGVLSDIEKNEDFQLAICSHAMSEKISSILGMPVEVPAKISKSRYVRITNLYKRAIEGKLLSTDPPNSAETPVEVVKPRACPACDRHVACVRRNTHYILWHQKHVQKEHLNAPKKGGKTQS